MCEDYNELSRVYANIVAEQIKSNPQSVLGLATGSTPVGMYERLAELYNENKVDFSGVTTFNLDEYYPIKNSDVQSYHTFMEKNLFSKVNLDRARTHVPNGETTDTAGECRSYEKMIEDVGGIDLQILGVGENGHIGFNEPDIDLSAGMHAVNLTESTLKANSRFFAEGEEMPSRALTMGMANIMKADTIILLASGKSKRAAISKRLSGTVSTECHVSFLQLHRDVVLIADKEAYPN